jgi:CBS domain-containing protein
MKIKERPEYKSKPAPFALRPDDVVPTAVKTMSEKNIGSVVIVDDAMQVKGIVTERDLMRRLRTPAIGGRPSVSTAASITATAMAASATRAARGEAACSATTEP